jgi:hypothetical protein
MEVTKKDVEKLIELRRKSSFLNHFKYVFSRDFRPSGEIRRSDIKVWRQHLWNMTFYPVFTFEFNSNNHLINISDRINPIGNSIITLISLGFLYLVFPKDPLNYDYVANWLYILFIAVFIILVVFVARKKYSFEKQNQLDEIFEALEIEVDQKISEKEWSLKNILIRMFTYPFSLFVIFICIWSLFENGVRNIFLTLFGMGVCVMYLYADIKMILRTKKTTGNN